MLTEVVTCDDCLVACSVDVVVVVTQRRLLLETGCVTGKKVCPPLMLLKYDYVHFEA